MTNPRTLLLSIAATACGFVLTLVGVAGPAPIAPADGSALAASLVSAVAEDADRRAPATFAGASELVVSDFRRPLDSAEPADGSASRFVVGHNGLIRAVHGGERLVAC